MKDTWTRKIGTVLTGLAFVTLWGVALRGLISTPQESVYAADTATVDVTATVVGTCQFLEDATLDFGTLDPSAGSDVTATTSLDFWCTKNATYTITDDDGLYETGPNQNRMRHASLTTEYIPYSFSYTPTSGTGQGKNSPITLTISGTVLGSDYIDASAGSYSDTVTLSITP